MKTVALLREPPPPRAAKFFFLFVLLCACVGSSCAVATTQADDVDALLQFQRFVWHSAYICCEILSLASPRDGAQPGVWPRYSSAFLTDWLGFGGKILQFLFLETILLFPWISFALLLMKILRAHASTGPALYYSLSCTRRLALRTLTLLPVAV